MANRSLTEMFILMRNNTIRNRHINLEQDSTERMALIALNDMERGDHNGLGTDRSPPNWLGQLEEAHFTLSKLSVKINELKTLHSQHLHRPTLDESSQEEALIETLTNEISVMFNMIHRLMQYIKSHAFDGSVKERRLTANVTRSIAAALQELSMQFRNTQSSYLKQINSREERSKVYFDTASNGDYGDLFGEEEIDECFVNSRQMTQQQLLYLEEENVQVAAQREQEVNTIVKSIVDLNDIFKDLSQMIVDQGTILDRIDYNIEQTQTQVYEGFKQLQKADMYQRKNRKMCCIIGLAGTIVVLIFLLVLIKS